GRLLCGASPGWSTRGLAPVGQDTLVASHRWHEAAQNPSAQRTLWSGAALRQVCAAHDAASTRRTAFAYDARTPPSPWQLLLSLAATMCGNRTGDDVSNSYSSLQTSESTPPN